MTTSRSRKQKQEEPAPIERTETIRRQIIEVLETGTFSAKDLSKEVHLSEKDIYAHLDHIRRTMSHEGRTFILFAPECRKCGFKFTRMDRLRKPGKCPKCRSESIHEPCFSLSQKQSAGEKGPGDT